MKTLTAVVESNRLAHQSLSSTLMKYCPTLKICKIVQSLQELSQLKKEETPELIFIDYQNLSRLDLDYLKKEKFKSEFIIIFDSNKPTVDFPINLLNPVGYLFKPLNLELLILTIENVKRIFSSKNSRQNIASFKNKIGIPTTQSLEFINIDEVVRCEGITNCTKIVTNTRKKNIVSSYNIGEFKKLLLPFGFYSPHKSHLINLSFINKYKKEGIIVMQYDEQSIIPVARAKRTEFLSLITRPKVF